MRAMRLHHIKSPLRLDELAQPQPASNEILLQVKACGVCRTDLHICDGELTAPCVPLTPGHEVIGEVVEKGSEVVGIERGTRIGIPWLGQTCGICTYCLTQRENLCDNPQFTGYTRDGGYADYIVADARFCLPIPARYSNAEAAPLLCAGLIGYRAYRMAGEGRRLGLYGFGAAAHLLAQIALQQGREVYAFTRPGDIAAQQLARRLGAYWAGGSDEAPPQALDAAILFAPVGSLLPQALRHVVKGGSVICAGIHMSDIPAFPYRWLWEERIVRSVANLTRADGMAYMALVEHLPIYSEIQQYSLLNANAALADLRAGRVQGAAVLTMNG